MPSPAELADRIEAELRTIGDRDRAGQERAYLKSDLEFLGVPVAAIRTAARRPRNLAHDEVVGLVEALWSVPIFERRLAAVEVLTASARLLTPDDVVLVERLLRDSRTWALVDGLAVHVVGALVAAYPELGATLDRWIEDDDFWLRRSALLALLVYLRQGDGDRDRFFGYADQLLDEGDFFIRKAIGWALRDLARADPAWVTAFVEAAGDRLSPLSRREATKHLPALRGASSKGGG